MIDVSKDQKIIKKLKFVKKIIKNYWQSDIYLILLFMRYGANDNFIKKMSVRRNTQEAEEVPLLRV